MMRGRFCLSDDSHGVEQVALNYHKCIPYLQRNHITQIHFLEHSQERLVEPFDSRFPCMHIRSLRLHELEKLPFWQILKEDAT
jgi:histidinol-phosphatase (PHP family)